MKCPTAILSKPCRLGETFLPLFDVMKCISIVVSQKFVQKTWLRHQAIFLAP
jgi:hypothetical protein